MRAAEVAQRLAPLAQAQMGYVVRQQALELGIQDLDLLRAVRLGYFEREGRGLYRSFGAPPHPLPQLWAPYLHLQALGCDPQAVFAAAQALYGLGSLEPEPQFGVASRPARLPEVPGLQLFGLQPPGPEVAGMRCQEPASMIAGLVRLGYDGGHVGELAYQALQRGLCDAPRLRAQLAPFAQVLAGDPGGDPLAALLAQAGWEL